MVASLLDKAPNLAGLSRTCEVGGCPSPDGYLVLTDLWRLLRIARTTFRLRPLTWQAKGFQVMIPGPSAMAAFKLRWPHALPRS